ncbi:ABC transporter permease [Candidatus Scalindua japonica]|uniref:ABC transporter permease n=1 Tax=Candidatus Scalindua japonica TaxID=1284222 RepID=UPI000BDE6BE0|nr:ABC transporter permease [Candidatus Scalindua japonica]
MTHKDTTNSNAGDLQTTVYSPESQMHTPDRLIRSMFNGLLDSRELAWRLFVRDISARYRQSILGIFWAFLPPLVTGLVFIILQSKRVVNLGETDIPYPVYVLVGTTLWQVFTEGLNAPLKSVIAAKPMLAKINFPREALIVSAFYDVLFNFLIKSVILVGIFVYFKVAVTWGLLLAPMAILILILLGISIGLLLTPLGTLYSDITQGLIVVTSFWFFITPVIYPPPQSFPYSLMSTLNPVSPILMGARDLLTKGVITNIGPFLVVSLLTIITLFIAWMIYRVALPILIERMSA